MKKNAILFLKGIAMGAADAVPGVSGGTIAFITGIYEELVASIRSFNMSAIRMLFSFQFKSFWHHINGLFLLVLFSGILISLALLSRIILFILTHYPILIWSFFFGLIIASTVVIGKKIDKWTLQLWIFGIIGIGIGYAITIIVPMETPNTLWFIFICGMIAICAMILPGISGSFILVLLSKYEFLLAAVKDSNFIILIVFGSGTCIGLISFSHILHWLLNRYYYPTIALLTGIMLGSLNKVWPWKIVLENYVNHHGIVKPLIEQNVLPSVYQNTTGSEPMVIYAFSLAIIGFIFVYSIERLTAHFKK